VLINTATALIPAAVKRNIIVNSEPSDTVIYSQEGEDKLLERFIGTKKYGIYVDVGAHHPTELSNTYFFYKKGWRGINIDAMPGSMKLFDEQRPYDINIECAIYNESLDLNYHIFNSSELNTFEESNVARFLKFPGIKLLETRRLKTVSLKETLDIHLPTLGTTEIDFMTVDVEGLDLNVLRSNDWDTYRPKIVLAEDLFSDLMASYNGELNAFMMSVGYTMKAKTFNTVFFQRNDSFNSND